MRKSTAEMDVDAAPGGLRSELLALLRHRIANHLYDDARVIDEIARALARLPVHLM